MRINTFKKTLLLFITLSLPCTHALASTADAVVVAPVTKKITAPYSGTLLPFDFTQGEEVQNGQVLFSYDSIPVYAPENGKVVSVFASPGDDAQGILSHYGTLALIEPEHPLYLDANTSQAYDNDNNRYLHAGELLYLKCGNDKGTGRVTRVDNDRYTVEILTGEFDLKDSVRCYRESGYANDSETGRGKVYRYADISVTGQGRIAACHVKEGDLVRTGDLLFECIDAMAPSDSLLQISAPASGALSRLAVSSGAQVYRGQLLCEITDLSKLELSCEIDEIDLPRIHLGDTLTYQLDAYPDRTFTGTVISIRPLGYSKQNAAYFDVRLSVTGDVNVLPGMNATVTGL